MKITALILAGGKGERFWPKSRQGFPKQFLKLTDSDKTMIQLTVERISAIVELSDIYISTNEEYVKIILDQLPNLPPNNIICEPVGKNTAPCIGLGAIHIASKYEDSLMLVLPADHLIRDIEEYRKSLRLACDIAEKDKNIVTLGIVPNYPETGYGYINYKNDMESKVFEVNKFIEKPDFEKAKYYLDSGDYLWNSGTFVWKTSTLLDNMKEYLPNVFYGLMEIKNSLKTTDYIECLNRVFYSFESISIDFGIMEKANDIFVIPGYFGWDDVGSWLSLERINKKDRNNNVFDSNVVSIKSSNNIVQSSNRIVATIGVQDLIVIDCEDAVLICNKNNTNDIKEIIKLLKEKNLENLL